MTSIDEVIKISFQCLTCNHKYSRKYDPPMTWELYTEQRDRKEFLCEKCNVPCPTIAFFEEAAPEQPDFDFNEIKKEVGDGPKSVIEMRRQLEGLVTGYGTLVGVTEQYVVISRTTATCSGNVRCACDAIPDEHTRPCGYSVDIKHDPPYP